VSWCEDYRRVSREASVCAYRLGQARGVMRVAVENADRGAEWMRDYLLRGLADVDGDAAEAFVDGTEAKPEAVAS